MGFLDSLFIGDEIERGKELDAKIRALNAEKEAKGVLTSGQRQAADAALELESGPVWADQINGDFSAGLDEGYANVTGGIKAAINAPARFLWDSIPWWVLVGAVLFGLWQIGSVRTWAMKLLKA